MIWWSNYGFVFQYVGNLISFVLVLVILSGRREARATVAWLVVVVVFPFIGALFYLLIGNVRYKRVLDRHFKAKKEFTDVQHYAGENDEYLRLPFGRMVERITGQSPELVGDVSFFINVHDKFESLLADIERAKHSIFMEYYIFAMDDVGNRMLNALTEKARQGVKVYLLYDGIGALSMLLFRRLRTFHAAGGKSGCFLNPFRLKYLLRLNFRNHRKIALIDGVWAYVGGMNIRNEDSVPFKKRPVQDLHLRFTGDAIHSVEQVFAEDWYFTTGEDLSSVIAERSRPLGGEFATHVIPSGPDQEAPNIYSTIHAVLNRANESVDIMTPYLVPDAPMIETLKNISRRGVRVRIVVPGKNDHPVVASAGRSYYEEMLESGVQIYETSGIMLHAKMLMVDNYWTTIGSANMDTRSFRLNFEMNLIVYSSDFAYRVKKVLDEALKNAHEVRLTRVQKRSYTVRVWEGMCRALSPIL